MPVKLIQVLGIAVIQLLGDLDMEDMVSLKNLVTSLTEEGRGQIVLDFGRVLHLNATGLGILADRLRFVRMAGGDLRLAGLTPALETLFDLTGIKRSFRVFATVQAAAESYRAVGVAA